MQSVLSNLERLFLLTEWRTGPDDTSVDKIGVGFDIGLPGDYNHDGVVNAADYVVWRKRLGSVYTQSDFLIWRAHFGEPAGEGSWAIGHNIDELLGRSKISDQCFGDFPLHYFCAKLGDQRTKRTRA